MAFDRETRTAWPRLLSLASMVALASACMPPADNGGGGGEPSNTGGSGGKASGGSGGSRTGGSGGSATGGSGGSGSGGSATGGSGGGGGSTTGGSGGSTTGGAGGSSTGGSGGSGAGGAGGNSAGGAGGRNTDAGDQSDGLKENELPTFENLRNYFLSGCVFCHPGETAVEKNTDFSPSDPKALYARITSATPTKHVPAACAFKRLVVPGKPMESLLYLKLLKAVPPNCGARMPSDKPQGADEYTISGIRRWIEAGAPGPAN